VAEGISAFQQGGLYLRGRRQLYPDLALWFGGSRRSSVRHPNLRRRTAGAPERATKDRRKVGAQVRTVIPRWPAWSMGGVCSYQRM